MTIAASDGILEWTCGLRASASRLFDVDKCSVDILDSLYGHLTTALLLSVSFGATNWNVHNGCDARKLYRAEPCHEEEEELLEMLRSLRCLVEGWFDAKVYNEQLHPFFTQGRRYSSRMETLNRHLLSQIV